MWTFCRKVAPLTVHTTAASWKMSTYGHTQETTMSAKQRCAVASGQCPSPHSPFHYSQNKLFEVGGSSPPPPYSSDLSPSDYHHFVPPKKHLGDSGSMRTKKYRQAIVRDWLRRGETSFYAAGIQALVQSWEK